MGIKGFGDLEAVVMEVLWSRAEPSTVRSVHDELVTLRQIAYTTVMSTMDNLHTKGWLARIRDGKAYRYWPTLTREQHSARLMCEALDGGGQAEVVLGYFLEQIGPDRSARLRTVLSRRGRSKQSKVRGPATIRRAPSLWDRQHYAGRLDGGSQRARLSPCIRGVLGRLVCR